MALAAATIGRYLLFDEIASGGMAAVHLGRLVGPVGFARTVAIKRLHAHLARDPEFVAMFLDEARLAARIRHANVVSTLDVVALDRELFVVMEYVLGDSLARLLRDTRARNEPVPLPIAATIMVNVLHGLHAAHEAKGERGEPLGLVHRDVSPHNVLVGADGSARVIDFGVAKAAGRAQVTRDGQVKGKLSYMAPEQLRGGSIDRRADVFGASIVFWEALTGQRLFDGDDEGIIYGKVLRADARPPSEFDASLGPQVDAIVLRGLAREPDDRYASARAMAMAIESALPMATPSSVGRWVDHLMAGVLRERRERLMEIERDDGAPSGSAVTRERDQALRDRTDMTSATWPSVPLAGSGGGDTGPRARLMGTLDATSADASLVAASVPDPKAKGGGRAFYAAIGAALLLAGVALYAWAPSSTAHAPSPPAAHEAPSPSSAWTTPADTAGPLEGRAVEATSPTGPAPAASWPTSAAPSAGPQGPSGWSIASATPGAQGRSSHVPVVTPDSLPSAGSPGSPSDGARPHHGGGTIHPPRPAPPPGEGASSPPTPARPAAVSPACDPPFTLDPDGTKRYKRECVR